MFVGCQAKPFEMNEDVRVIRNLRQNPQDPSSPYLGTIFIPATRLNEASIEITPPDKCVTWCLGTDAATGQPKCSTLSLDPALSTIKDNSRVCPESRVMISIGEPTFRCEGTNAKNLITDIPAIISGGANAAWKVTCPPDKAVTVTPAARTVRLAVPAAQAPVSCTVELTAELGGYVVTATPKSVTLSTSTVPAGECQESLPVDSCNVPNGNNECLDCKGIPFGPNVVVKECGCVDSTNPNSVVSCYKCTRTDISKILAAVDSRLKDMEFIVARLLKAEAKLLGKSPEIHKAKVRQAAHTAQVSGWTIVWTKIEHEVFDCPLPNSAQICTLIAPEQQQKALGSIRCHADNLLELGKRVAASIQKNAAKIGATTEAAKKALRTVSVRFTQLQKIHSDEVAGINSLPNTYVTCSRKNATVTIEANLSCTALK